MKRILIIGLLACYTHVTIAQNAEEVASPNIDTATIAASTVSAEERLNKQEQEIEALKKDNQLLKKQINQLKSSLPNVKRRLHVSRVGSKQLITE